MEITDVLGRVRPVDKVFPAGEWNCPFCLAAVCPERTPCYATACTLGAHCPNPACFANPHYPVERARAEMTEAARRKREDDDRRANHEWAMKRAEEESWVRERQRVEVVEEARRRGACATCALRSIRFSAAPKYTKHRVKCSVSK